MRFTRIFTAVLLGLPAAAMSAALTNNNIDTRTTTNAFSFSDLAFDHLDMHRSDALQFHGAVGDSGKFTITGYLGPSVAVSVAPGAGMFVFNQTRDPSTGSISYNAVVTGNGNQTITQSWNLTTSSSMIQGVSGDGLHTLEIKVGNNGFLKEGGVFDDVVTLAGNWSTAGTATGDFELLGLNPEFTITRDFVFDAATDTTTVEVVNDHYDVGNPNVGLDFVLFGSSVSPVDEPLPAGLLLGGLGLLGGLARRRRAAA